MQDCWIAHLCGSDLSRHDIEQYYCGSANQALWPICHYRLDLAKLSDCNAAAYFRVNEQFARELHKLLRRDDIIWVHDYHLIPMARFLRQMGCANRIGFFLHIPWPGPDVASALPAYQRILRCFGAYDVVGFQTEVDADNFRDCIVAAKAGRAASGDWCEIDGRRMQVSAFPIGIDSEAIAQEARAAEKNSTVKRMLASLEGRDLVIGVDRLDYSKGLKQRMAAFATFLQLRGRSFARSALFHWFRALRAYPRSATRSLDTTSLWFPEWRCFHIEPPCKYAAPLVEQFGQGTENASTKYWTQTKFGRSVILLDQIVEGLSRSHWPMICRAARCEGVMARQPALALARPRRRPTKISMRAVRTRA